MEPMITTTKCFEECKRICLGTEYGFVWLFIVGFLFTSIGGLIFNWNLLKSKPKLQQKLIAGFKMSGDWLTMGGIIWFLVTLI